MADVYGSGDFIYQHVDGWGKLPDGMSFVECPGVAVDSQDNVYVLTRGEHPIIVFDREGKLPPLLWRGRVQRPDPRALHCP